MIECGEGVKGVYQRIYGRKRERMSKGEKDGH